MGQRVVVVLKCSAPMYYRHGEENTLSKLALNISSSSAVVTGLFQFVARVTAA